MYEDSSLLVQVFKSLSFVKVLTGVTQLTVTVIGKKNKTDEVVQINNFGHSYFLSPPITEHYESGKQLESLTGMLHILN